MRTDGSEVSGFQESIRNTPGPGEFGFVPSSSRESSFQSSSKVGVPPHFTGLEGLSSNCGNVLHTGAGILVGPRFPGFSITQVSTAPCLRGLCKMVLAPWKGLN